MRSPSSSAFALAAFLALVHLAACGGGEDGSTDDPSGQGSRKQVASGTVSARSAPFQKYSGDSPSELQIAEFGTEGSAEDRLAAQAVVNAYLRATKGGHWARACGYVSVVLESQIDELIRRSKQTPKPSCGEVLEALGTSQAAGKRPVQISAPGSIASLRIKEGPGGGFALFHGDRGKDYWIAVRRDSPGQWGVLSIAAQEFSLRPSARPGP